TSGPASIDKQRFAGGGSLEVIRLSTAPYDKSRNLTRVIWTLRANARLLCACLRDPRSRRAELLFTGSPPFMLYFAVLAKLARRTTLIYRISDFHPEAMIAELPTT